MNEDFAFPIIEGSWTACPASLLKAGMSSGAKFLWLTLRLRCIGKVICWPSYAVLAKDMQMTERNVIYLMNELSAAGWVVIKPRRGGSNQYRPIVPGQDIKGLPYGIPDAPGGEESFTGETDVTTPPTDGSPPERNFTPGVQEISPTPERNFTQNYIKEINKEKNKTYRPTSADAPVEAIKRDVSSKKTMPKKPADPRLKRLIDFYFEHHVELKGFKPHIVGGRDGEIFKRLLRTCETEDEVRERLLAFFEDPLSFMDRPAWTLQAFEKMVSKYADRTDGFVGW